MTDYIGHPLRYESPATGLTAKAELRVEPSEEYDGHLDIGTYGYNSGNELGRVIISRTDAADLRDALSKWLGDTGGSNDQPE